MRKSWLLCLASSLLCLHHAEFSFAKTMYVATSGSDLNPGTQSTPFRSIQKAVNLVSPGDTVLVRGGSYTEQIVIKISGTAGNMITLKPEPGTGTVFIKHPTTQPLVNKPVIDLFPASFIRIEGFYFKDSLTSNAIRMYDSTQGVNFQKVKAKVIGNQLVNNTFENVGIDIQPASQEIVKIYQAQDILVENNHFTNCYGIMIALYDSYRITVRGNVISGMRDNRPSWTPEPFSAGVWQDGAFTFLPGDTRVIGGYNLIQNNTILDADGASVRSTGIRLDGGAHNTTIANNRIRGASAGIYLESRANSNMVKENICWNGVVGFNTANHGTTYPTKNDVWINNVAYNNSIHGFAIRNTLSLTFQNNIAFNNGLAQVMITQDAVVGGLTFNNNLWFKAGTPLIGVWNCPLNIYNGNLGDAGCTNSAKANLTLQQWNTASGEKGAISADPKFVNTTVGSEDFHLQAGSPAIGAGAGGVDIGAYPQNAAAPSPPQGLRVVP